MKRTALRPRSRRPSGVPGKLGIVRLYGAALTKLRWKCWDRDEATCQECGTWVCWVPRFDGDPRAYDMAHIKSRGAGGSDVLENVRVLCHSCHMKEHTQGKRVTACD